MQNAGSFYGELVTDFRVTLKIYLCIRENNNTSLVSTYEPKYKK